MAMMRIYRYIQGTNDNGLLFNPSKTLVVDCYADADFVGLWGHENPQNPICASSRTGFVVTFANRPLLLVSKLQIEIVLYTLHPENVALSHSIRELILLKILIKEVIENLGIYIKKLKFVSSPTVYEDNNGDIVVEKIPRTTSTYRCLPIVEKSSDFCFGRGRHHMLEDSAFRVDWNICWWREVWRFFRIGW